MTTTVKKGPSGQPGIDVDGCRSRAAGCRRLLRSNQEVLIGGADIELTTAGGLTEPETKAVVQEAAKQADAEGLEEDKPAVVASALDSARGTKAMLRSGVTPDDAPDGLELLRDPDALANYARTGRSTIKFKHRPMSARALSILDYVRRAARKPSLLSLLQDRVGEDVGLIL